MNLTKLEVTLFLQLSLLIVVVASVTQAQTRQTAKIERELYLIVKNGRFGYIERNGRVAIQPRYKWAFPFSEGLALVLVGKKQNEKRSAYIDKRGRVVVKPFDGSASQFSGGVAKVLLGAQYVYMNKKGRWVSRFYQNAEDCTEGLCAVKMDTPGPKMWGYINTSGVVIVTGQYDWAEPFKEGIARVGIMIGGPSLKDGSPAVDGKEGYIDRAGKQIASLEFDKAWDFSNGMAQVRLKSKWGYIDKTGRLVIPAQYDETHAFHEDFAGVKVNNLWGFIDKTGKLMIPPQFEFVNDFSEGLAAVGRPGENFYIDRSGKIVLSRPFESLGPFREGLATFRVGEKAGVINKAGKVVLDAQFASIEILSGGVIGVEDPKKGIGYADRTGRFFWPPIK